MSITKQQKQEILDKLGKKVIEFRDRSLSGAMRCVAGNFLNPISRNKYSELAKLSKSQYELVCDLLSETITSTIFEFLNTFEEEADWMKFLVKHNGQEYDLCDISEKMGSEIACYDEDGWIQKFSKIGRFVL